MPLSRRTLLFVAGVAVVPIVFRTLSDQFSSLVSDHPSLSMLAEPKSPAPFEFVDASGESYSLAKFAGRSVLLNVWATWCPPCREELPSFDRLKAILNTNSEIAVIAISVDDVSIAQLQAFYGALDIKHLDIYRGNQGAVMSALGILGLPTTVMLDAEGLEVARLVGPTKWDDPPVIDSVVRAAEHA